MQGNDDRSSAARRTTLARIRLNARAVGIWSLQGDALVQLAFEAAPGMSDQVAQEFAEATRVVALDQLGLGIVKAASEGRVVVSVADELDPTSGSGYWLRAFGADRSIAVPRLDPWGAVIGVFSVAMPGLDPDAEAVCSILRSIDQG